MKKLREFFCVTILTILGIFAFSQDALANPKWIKTTYSWKVVRVGKHKNKPGYFDLIITMHHKNNSKKGDVVTAIYDKNINVSYKLDPGKVVTFKAGYKFSDDFEIVIPPGETRDLVITIPMKIKGKGGYYWYSYDEYNDVIQDLINIGRISDIGLKVKYDFKVKVAKKNKK